MSRSGARRSRRGSRCVRRSATARARRCRCRTGSRRRCTLRAARGESSDGLDAAHAPGLGGQCLSSAASWQSGSPSQRHVFGMQR
ncbi:hypothetical protein V5799_033922 [Amblyomma americanum]|uniref:Uncharacterized protein n=1 Tax=Amblyomma americanum TaxID=6943 RepID=A0AAQ4DLY1_AMBAM